MKKYFTLSIAIVVVSMVACNNPQEELFEQNWKLNFVGGHQIEKMKSDMMNDSLKIEVMKDSLTTLKDSASIKDLRSEIDQQQNLYEAMYPNHGVLADSFYIHTLEEDSFFTNINGFYGGIWEMREATDKKAPTLLLKIAGDKNETWQILKITKDSLVVMPYDGVEWTFISEKSN